jgi:hypothetical protein
MSKFRSKNTVQTEHLEREIGLYEAKEEAVAVIALRRLARDIKAPIREAEIANWKEVYQDELRRQHSRDAEARRRKADMDVAKLDAAIAAQGDQTPDADEMERRRKLVNEALRNADARRLMRKYADA